MDKKREGGVILVISVLLHGLLALLPWQDSSRPLAVSSSSTGPISLVDASQLPTLPSSESQPIASSSLPEPVISPPADPPEIVDAPLPEPSDDPEPAPEPAPEPDWTAGTSDPETGDNPTDSTAPNPVSNAGAATNAGVTPNNNSTPGTSADDQAKIAAAEWQQLVGYFKDQDDGFGLTLFETFDFFKKSEEQLDQFFDENNQPKLDVSSFYYFQEKAPEQVFQDVVIPELKNKKGFDLQPQENFPAGLAYQLLQGEVIRYLIIVGLSEDNGSVLLLSDSLPGLEP